MEVYILDSLLRRIEVVDNFESLIWTERFSAYGDFEIHLNSTVKARSLFTPGTLLSMNESFYVMKVETVEDSTDNEGKNILVVKGKSLESILENRVARNSLTDLTSEPKWIITDLPAEIAREIFNHICVLGSLDPGDVIPFITPGTIFEEDTIGEPSTVITYEIEPKSVYDAIKELCDLYDMGFRLVRNFDTSQLYFNIYMGSNRTTGQTTLPAVIFSPDLDNLQNTSSLTTVEGYKNVAYVFSPVGYEIVYAESVDPEVEGFERQVIVVNASDITDTDPEVASAAMIQRGKEELGKHRQIMAFDGELSQRSQYKYGRDYNLGDLVELRNVDGVTNNMQVTEQIFVSDKEGERSYPTLSLKQFITPGTWLAWDFQQEWEDLGEEEYWEDM